MRRIEIAGVVRLLVFVLALLVGSVAPWPEARAANPLDGLDDYVTKAMAEAAKAGRKAALFQISRDDTNRFVAMPIAKG